jgi:hypothetical protein
MFEKKGWGRRAALVAQSPLDQLPGALVQHGDLLTARVKITSCNQPAAAGSAPFSEPWSFERNQVYSVEGADAVIQSAQFIVAKLS